MVFLDESRLSWLTPLRRNGEKKASSGSEADDKDCWRAFDIADDMEKGFARELVFDFTQPLPESGHLWKFQVQRSADKLQYRLYCDSGEFLLFAKLSRDGRRADIFLYDPLEESQNCLYDPERPAFTLAGSAQEEWTLRQDRCDLCRHTPRRAPCACQGRSEVMRAWHTKENVGEGISHCLDTSFQLDVARGQDEQVRALRTEEQRLVTKLPVWNEKVESLVLDFTGRRVLASAKNFQLALEDAPEHVVCQYAKIGADAFGLDFRYPLTVVQAFALSLTTLHWV
jgi:hypothetical protein